jgi:hypothetical protein
VVRNFTNGLAFLIAMKLGGEEADMALYTFPVSTYRHFATADDKIMEGVPIHLQMVKGLVNLANNYSNLKVPLLRWEI